MNHKLFPFCLQRGLRVLFMATLMAILILGVSTIQGVSAANPTSSNPKPQKVIAVYQIEIVFQPASKP